MVADVPVRHIAAPGVRELADGLAVAAGKLDGLLSVLHGEQAVLLGLMVIQLRQRELRAALEPLLPGYVEELALYLPLLGLVYQAAVVYTCSS